MKTFVRILLVTLSLLAASSTRVWSTPAPAPAAANRAEPSASRWEARVGRYLEKDKTVPPAIGGIVFTGSSSIDMWGTLASDFPGWPVVRRGIGGTMLAELPDFAPQLVYPLKPRIVVVYAGENDLELGRTVADVVDAFKHVRAQIRAQTADAPVVFIALKPSPRRRALTAQMREANDQIAALCAADKGCTFIDVFTPMLDAQGEPRTDLFIEDALHMNAKGYRLWTELVTPVLTRLDPSLRRTN